MITIGTSQETDSEQAGQQAAQMALDQLGKDEQAGWALTFCGGRHNGEAILQGLRATLGQIPVVGGAAIGTITNQSLSYSGYECAVAVFPASIPQPHIIPAYGLDSGEAGVGSYLAGELRKFANEKNTVLLFYDSLRSGPPPVLNAGSLLVDGIYDNWSDTDISLIGAGTLGDYQFSTGYVFDGTKVVKNGAVAVVLPPSIRNHTTIMHGCIPIGSFLEITRIEGAVVYELNGRPALHVILELFGEAPDSAFRDSIPLTVALGQKQGDHYALYDESQYVNRLIVGTNPDDGSLILFEADFSPGTEIQIMSRDNQAMIDSVRKRAAESVAAIEDGQPILALYIDCAGRTCYFCGSDIEEAGIIQETLGSDIPLLGFYSGVEIAPLFGRSRPLDWTGVLTILSH